MRFEIQGDGDIEAEKEGRERKKGKENKLLKEKRKENRGGPSVVPTIQN